MFGHDEHDNGNNPANDNHHDDSAAADDLIKPTAGDDGSDWHHPGPPPSNGSDDGSDNTNHDQPAETPEPPAATPAEHLDAGAAGNELIDLKREALTKLSPLVDKLEQTPDEKFRTIMMMIQASDNQDLVKQAYEAALAIDDEKERAQALLDIVNEINYFTHNQAKPE